MISAVAAVLALAAPVLAAPDEVDATFGDGSVTRLPLHDGEGFTYQVSDVAVGEDGSSVLLGGIFRSTSFESFTGDEFDLAIARLGPDGQQDPSFGTDGVARFDVGGLEFPARVAVDGQDRVLFSANQFDGTATRAILGRVMPDGTLDPSFGDGGLVRLDDSPMIFAGELAIDAEDRPAVAVLAAQDQSDATARAELRRLTVDGVPDPSFGNAGTARVVEANAGAFGVDMVPGGYLVSGVVSPTGPFVARLDLDGRLDTGFGEGGVAGVAVPGGVAFTVGGNEDGTIVAGGSVGTRSGLLVRLTSTGALDQSFGIGGVRTVRADDAGPMPLVDVGAGPSGSLVLTGPQLDASPRSMVARLQASGLEDAGFGTDGYVRPLEDEVLDASIGGTLAVDSEGRVVATGVAVAGDDVHAFATRLLSTPTGAPVTEGTVERVAGQDRIDTAIALGRQVFADGTDSDGRNASSAVLADSDGYPDALVAAPYAAAMNAALLLNPTERLDARVRDELARLLPDGGTVTLMGGYAAIGIGVEAELRGAGYNIARLAGNDRYETSVRVAESLSTRVAILARGDAFPDALTAGPAAAEIGGAVLLTAGREVPDSVRAYLDEHPDALVYAVGGDAAAAEPSATPVVGADRYDTAARVATRFFATPPRTVVASGEKFPDAVAGGTVAALTGSPLLLATTNTLPSSGAEALRRGRGFHRQVILAGGTGVLADAVLTATRNAVG